MYPNDIRCILQNIVQVTAASEVVYGFEKRDGFIRAKAENRELMPAFSSKKDISKLVIG